MLDFRIINKSDLLNYSGYNFFTYVTDNNIVYAIYSHVFEYDFDKHMRPTPDYIGFITEDPSIISIEYERGKMSLNLDRILPATKTDFNKIISVFSHMSAAKESETVQKISAYIKARINKLLNERGSWSDPKSEYHKKQRINIDTEAKKLIANNEQLIKYGADIIEYNPDNNTTTIKFKKGYSFTMGTDNSGARVIKRYPGLTFSFNGYNFTMHKTYKKGSFIITFADNGLKIIDTDSKNTVATDLNKIFPRFIELINKDPEKMQKYRIDFINTWNNREIQILDNNSHIIGTYKAENITPAPATVKAAAPAPATVKAAAPEADKKKAGKQHGGKRPKKGYIMKESVYPVENTFQYDPAENELMKVWEYKTARIKYRFSVHWNDDITCKANHIIMGDPENKNTFILPENIQSMINDPSENIQAIKKAYNRGLITYDEMIKEIYQKHILNRMDRKTEDPIDRQENGAIEKNPEESTGNSTFEKTYSLDGVEKKIGDIDLKSFADLYYKIYEKLYHDRKYASEKEYPAMIAYEKNFIADYEYPGNNVFMNLICAFARERQDAFTSDRELAAFWIAYTVTIEEKKEEKEAAAFAKFDMFTDDLKNKYRAGRISWEDLKKELVEYYENAMKEESISGENSEIKAADEPQPQKEKRVKVTTKNQHTINRDRRYAIKKKNTTIQSRNKSNTTRKRAAHNFGREIFDTS